MGTPTRPLLDSAGHVLCCLSRAEELRDSVTNNHEQMVGLLAAELCHAFGLGRARSIIVGEAARLHDIGKFVLPSEILHKQGKLSDEEWAFIRRHPEIGHSILSIEADEFLRLAATIALQHHEHFDGSGYPNGLSGDDIAVEARVVAVADTYEALRADRAYKRGVDHDQAITIILSGDSRSSPAQFDPAALRALEQAAPTLARQYDRSRNEMPSTEADSLEAWVTF